MNRWLMLLLCMMVNQALSGAHFRGLSVVSDEIAWMSGSQGSVMRTVDGGTHWDTLNPPGYSHRDFRDIHAWNAEKAVIMSAGDSAVLLITRNGGKSWTLIASDNHPGVFWDAIDISGKKLILAGDGNGPDLRYSLRLKTVQGFKATYYRQKNLLWDMASLTESGPASLYAASGTAVQWTGGKTFAYIPVYGNTCLFIRANMVKNKKFPDPTIREKWSQTILGYSILPFKNQKAGGAYSFALHESYGVAVGGSYLYPDLTDSIASYSIDSGKSWQPCEIMPGGYRSCVCKTPVEGVWFCTGTNGTDASFDYGKTWQNTVVSGFNVCACSEHYIWFAGNKGTWKRYQFSELLP